MCWICQALILRRYIPLIVCISNTRSRTIFVSNSFVLDSVDEADELFSGNNNLIGGNGTAFSASNPTNKTYARIDEPGTPGYFTRKP